MPCSDKKDAYCSRKWHICCFFQHIAKTHQYLFISTHPGPEWLQSNQFNSGEVPMRPRYLPHCRRGKRQIQLWLRLESSTRCRRQGVANFMKALNPQWIFMHVPQNAPAKLSELGYPVCDTAPRHRLAAVTEIWSPSTKFKCSLRR